MSYGNLMLFYPHRPGDTILIAAGGSHVTSNIQIKKPLCLVRAQLALTQNCCFLRACTMGGQFMCDYLLLMKKM